MLNFLHLFLSNLAGDFGPRVSDAKERLLDSIPMDESSDHCLFVFSVSVNFIYLFFFFFLELEQELKKKKKNMSLQGQCFIFKMSLNFFQKSLSVFFTKFYTFSFSVLLYLNEIRSLRVTSHGQ